LGVTGGLFGVRAVLFDVNGTLVDIHTEEGMEQIFRAVGHFLTYQGVDLRRGEVRDRYFTLLKEQQRTSSEEYPEFDSVAIWRTILDENATAYTRALPPEKYAQLPLFLAEMSRGVSRRRLRLYPHVREVLNVLRTHLPLAVVTDAQAANARGELHQVGLLDYFDPIVVSGDHGFRKPDPRLFQYALDALGVAAEDAVHVGNDMHRDIFGAQAVGLRTVMFDSDQGTKEHPDTAPDHTIADHRELLGLLGLPRPG
jgi:putative hydrolase of the HAD superfamily